MTAGNSESDVRLIRRIESLLDQPVTAEEIVFDYLPGGYSNENYRFSCQGSTFVLRIPNRPRPFVDRTLELAFYQQTLTGLSIPELIALDPDSGCMLTRYEPGDLLADSPPELGAIIQYFKPFHAALPDSSRDYDPLALSRAYLSVGGAPGSITRLSEHTWEPAIRTTCHNDLNPWNIIQTNPDRWVTLDWEWLGNNDPLFDLITLHEGLTLTHSEFDDQSLKTLVAGWSNETVTNARLEQCLTAFWLREFAWAWAERHHGNERQEIEDQIKAATDRLKALSS